MVLPNFSDIIEAVATNVTAPVPNHPVNQTKPVIPKTQSGQTSTHLISQLSVRDAWLIIVVSLCFFFLSMYILVRICSINAPIERRGKSGYKYKIVFLSLLFVCCLTRSLVNVGNFVSQSLYVLDLNLLYLPCYSVFIYFFGRLTSQGDYAFTLTKALLIVLNLLAYASYIFMSVYYRQKPPVDLSTISTFVLLVLIFLIQVTLVVMIKKKMSSMSKESKEYGAFKRLARRSLILSSFMTVLFFLRYIHYLLYVWGIIDGLFKTNEYRMTGESIFYFIAEFIPILIVVILFSQKKINVFNDNFQAEEVKEWTKKMYHNDEYGTFIDEENSISEDEFKLEYLNMDKNLRQKLLVNEFRRQLF